MKTVVIKIAKVKVYNDVAMTTSYTGHKIKDDATAYDRIFTTDEDREQLERFWVEACNIVTDSLKRFSPIVSKQQLSPVSHGVDLSVNYEVTMSMPDVFDSNLRDDIEASIHSFFVLFVTSRWFRFVHKEEAESYAVDANGMLDTAIRQLRYRLPPTLTAPSVTHSAEPITHEHDYNEFPGSSSEEPISDIKM